MMGRPASSAARSTRPSCAKLHGELVAMQEWVKATGAKVCIVFEGRDTAGKGGTIKRDHRAGQPAGVPRRRAAGADRAREVADVRPALHAALPGGRRGRHLRPQLVQPRRRRAGDGLLHARSRPSSSSSWRPAVEKAMVDSGIILLKYWLEVERGRADPAAREPHRRPAQDLEAVGHGPEVLQPLVRLLPGPRRRCSRRPTPPWAPWYVAHTDDKKRGRLNIISHLLRPGPLRAAARAKDVTLPKRQKADGYEPSQLPAQDPDTVLTLPRHETWDVRARSAAGVAGPAGRSRRPAVASAHTVVIGVRSSRHATAQLRPLTSVSAGPQNEFFGHHRRNVGRSCWAPGAARSACH